MSNNNQRQQQQLQEQAPLPSQQHTRGGDGSGRQSIRRSRSPYINTNRRHNNNNYNQRTRYNNNRRQRSSSRSRGSRRQPSQRTTRLPTTTTTDALPQRTTTNGNDTQPFIVNPDDNNDNQPYDNNNDQPYDNNNDIQPQQQQQQSTRRTTSGFRRRQRRNRQQHYRQQNNNNDYDYNNNRFAALANLDDNNDNGNDDDNNDYDNNNNNNSNKTNNKNKQQKKKKSYFYLSRDQLWKHVNQDRTSEFYKLLQDSRTYDITKNYLLTVAPVYDEWIRTNHEFILWTAYKQLGENDDFWAKEIINRIRSRPDKVGIKSFVDKKINSFQLKLDECSVTINKLQKEFAEYWSQVALRRKQTQPSTMATRESTTARPASSFDFEKMEKELSDYIHNHTKHVKKYCNTRLEIANLEKEEYQALQNFKNMAEKKPIWNFHLLLQTKLTKWDNKNRNFHKIQKRMEYNLLPRFIEKHDFTFKIDTKVFEQDEIQSIYDGMRELTNSFKKQSMEFYYQVAARELNNVRNGIDIIIENCRPSPPSALNLTVNEAPDDVPDDQDSDDNNSNNSNKEDKQHFEAFELYYKLCMKRHQLQAEQSHGPFGPNIINQASNIQLNEDEYHILKLGPRFIFNDPKIASQRRTKELSTLRRKLESRFHEKKVNPGRPAQEFINELDLILQNYHDIHTNPRLSISKRKNYHRIVKRLKYKLRLANVIIRKTDKSKVFHLGTSEHYDQQSIEYMERTKAYECIGSIDPLPKLIQHTNEYLLGLRLKKWISQKQYEQLCLKQTDDIELAHLYYLPKAHKPSTPLRPIISGLKHPTLKISKFLDDLLRPLFNQMASKTTITCGFELIKHLQKWSSLNLYKETSLCTIDIVDLYTMIPQVAGVMALKKMLNHLQLQKIGELTTDTIIQLARFVMENNYFKYKDEYYHQIRGGAMGSPLTLTIANCYMFFFEQSIIRQITNSHGLYFRYIDDIIIIVNWPNRHLKKEVNRWNTYDENIQLSDTISNSINFLDLHIENKDGQLITNVFTKPSYQPYFLPFNSIHPLHMKANIPFTMLLRAIRYCSTFQSYLQEREHLRMALLLNQYSINFIDQQFNRLLVKFNILQPLTSTNYNTIRLQVINSPYEIISTKISSALEQILL
ncbi:unnamed protein product [Adineta steineri]|uniref:Reverse transcriptase domain-containing protein n=1 Tax=Adineta steineri TaxID=433720 RepID=A0A815S6U9_9BILA|nr:unnamed protein product [Adineta steineri]CAF1640735.1 unnamed protein product [Adineta steineri]